jgi:adenylate cyclase
MSKMKNLEIERKFLVDKEKWELVRKPKGQSVKQIYLLNDSDKTIRIRIKGEKGFLTLKGETKGFSRSEFEYEIPLADAQSIFAQFAGSLVEKIRYEIVYQGKLWEVDEFVKENQGLLLAEIELTNEQESFEIPEWILEEVSSDPRYYNSFLSMHPFQSWK